MKRFLYCIGILFVLLTISGCSKSKPEETTIPPSDYRVKYVGNYQCSGQYIIYGDSTKHIDTTVLVYVTKSENNHVSMNFKGPNFTADNKVKQDGTFGENPGDWYGRFTSGDSIYLFSRTIGHIGSREWVLSGKRM